jgi:hypothetical protein
LESHIPFVRRLQRRAVDQLPPLLARRYIFREAKFQRPSLLGHARSSTITPTPVKPHSLAQGVTPKKNLAGFHSPRISPDMNQPVSPSITKILFLDIDGVLNTTATMLANPGTLRFAPSASVALKIILAATECHIVITSTRSRAGLKPIMQAFRENGLSEVADRIIDSTPFLSDSDTDEFRTDEILEWLHTSKFQGLCAALDDAPLKNFPAVTVSHDTGLTLRDADLVIAWLG